ncbi:LysE family translocator [Methylibium rhizosphaerae]|uniref:LysE family translocator n=1 Tax=Methylibium rhizosphaerae TaxID=2570323 RepID=UPI00112BA0E8|nr:LysE family translocator [Methylibium rhizosphaerae]
MTAQEFGALLFFASAMSFSPGPNTTLSTALAANFGLRRALPFCLAVPVGWSLLMLLCGAGLGVLVLAVPALRWAVKAVGVAYLLWLAWKLANTGVLGQADAKRLNVSFPQGMALQFVNIKAWMLALTIAAGWVAPAGGDVSATMARLGQVLAVMVVFAFVSNFSYALVGSLLRGWLAQGRRLLWFNRGMALVLVLTAAWMVRV